MCVHNQLVALLIGQSKNVDIRIYVLWANGKEDSPEVEIVLTRHLQRHARPRSTILNSSFACSTAGNKVKE